ncbi:serine hydrolase domain-containing protein [Compostimonas suwonensis]|uniref:D-alanyl-D-alanine carboxypeptidase n=1 Tax=Compostimonas suwonensis TaxID=1048394 RepID=A0A2M9C4F5_9MICO|nr:serine hydrolase domain-containing protein [Compostimonas suwonensis]PJJ65347.1 D-alanyl-D-alanine carboxypeptidase [Compostimonas suwonensis]
MRKPRGRTRRGVIVALVAAGSILLSGCSPSADANMNWPAQVEAPFATDVSDRLDAAVRDAMALAGATGAIAGVWAPWAGQWVQGEGVTTQGGSAPVTENTRFRIASNTKPMSCTVLLTLVDEGTVGLDDPVSEYLPRMSGIEGITLRQLCQNTSGLADYHSVLGAQFTANPTRVWPPLELLSAGMALPRVAAPGETYSYSDTGYLLLGLALQAATQKDWASLYSEYVFGPAGMGSTSFPPPSQMSLDGESIDGYVTPVDPATGQLQCGTLVDETRLSNSMAWTAGGAVSTLHDLRHYVQDLAAGSLLSDKTATEQTATVPLGPDSPTWQGYGLGVLQLGPMIGHDGQIPGYISAMFSDPTSGLTVVVMLNNSTAGEDLAQLLALRLASIAAKAPAANGKESPLVELPWSEEQMVASMAALPVCPPPAAPAQ